MKQLLNLIPLLNALRYSFAGIRSAISSERAFTQELIVAAVGVVAAVLLDVTSTERVLLIAVLFLILIVELINSAIEAVVDLQTSEIHPLAKRAKDFGSAAVFLTIGLAVFTWVVILFA